MLLGAPGIVLLGARMLLGAPGLKELLGTASNKDATRGSWHRTTRSKDATRGSWPEGTTR